MSWCLLCWPVYGRKPRRALPIAPGAPAYCIQCLDHTTKRLAAVAAEPEQHVVLGRPDPSDLVAQHVMRLALECAGALPS